MKYGISLNPKKYIFAVTKGKLFGFLVSKDDMVIEPKINEAIAKMTQPMKQKDDAIFLGKK